MNLKIKIGKYNIENEPASKELFNISKDTVSEKGTKYEVSLGYGVRLDRALTIIINDKMGDKQEADKKEYVTLEEYLKTYKDTMIYLNNLVLKTIKENK